jgi:hypothetical protein
MEMVERDELFTFHVQQNRVVCIMPEDFFSGQGDSLLEV